MEVAALQTGRPTGVVPRPSPPDHVPRARAAADSDSVATAADVESSVAIPTWDHKAFQKKEIPGLSPEQEAAINEILTELMNMTDVERADLIDELTRKAFVLMDAGEVQKASENLQRITRISEAFAHLQRMQKGPEKGRKQTDEEYLGIKDQSEVLMVMRSALHSEDFGLIFGGQARWAQFIGAW